MAILGRGRPNPATIVIGQGVQVSGTPVTVVVTAPRSTQFRIYNRGTTVQTAGLIISGPTVVVTRPIDRRFLRVNPSFVGQGAAEPVPGPILVSTPRNPKILAPRPIILTAPFEEPATPGSPLLGPYVFPGPNPHRTVGPPTVFTLAPGIPAPVNPGPDPDFCAGPPFTSWTAHLPFTDWDAGTPGTSWSASAPKGDC